MLVLPVDLDNAGAADDAALVLDDPVDDVGVSARVGQPLFLCLERGRELDHQEAGHLEVLEPLHHRRHVVFRGRAQAHDLALDHRPVHGRKGY